MTRLFLDSTTARPTHRRLAATLFLALLLIPALALAYKNRVATDANGKPLHIQGSVVVIEPDIQLSEVLAGGVQEPRREWTENARRLYPVAVRNRLAAAGKATRPDYIIDDDMPPESRLGQIIRLNEAVSLSVLAYTQPGNELATKGDRLDWTLGPGAAELQKATGADYALFTYVRDSYTSAGRKALRIIGFIALGGDIGGGSQIGVTTLVDLRTGQVVWFNFLARQTGHLPDPPGRKAKKSVAPSMAMRPATATALALIGSALLVSAAHAATPEERYRQITELLAKKDYNRAPAGTELEASGEASTRLASAAWSGAAGAIALTAEGSRFRGDLGVVDDLKRKVAQFFLEGRHVVAFDGVGNLVGFLDRVRCDRPEGLVDVPGATMLAVTQPGHHGEEAR